MVEKLDLVKSGQTILVLWENPSSQNCLETFVSKLKEKVGEKGKVCVENAKQLSEGDYATSSFDVIFSGTVDSVNHTDPLLAILLKLSKLNGDMLIRKEIGPEPNISKSQFISKLKTSGFLVINDDFESTLDNAGVIVHCRKPNFEVGSSVKLSFASTSSTKVESVWKIDDTVDEDVDVINPDDLLDEDDLKKPDPAALRVCGTTGKRKACKNCSCGLADELEAEVKDSIPKTKDSDPKSSCGNCYLGDAFRCASCPYLGMPAFKPGEKIQLSDNQLKADA